MNVPCVSSVWGQTAYPAVSGLRDATLRLDVAANNVANAASDGFTPSRVVSSALPGGGVQSTVTPSDLEGGVDLPTEIVSAMIARAAFSANAHVLAQSFETQRRLLDILA